jgi:hypothetical protein
MTAAIPTPPPGCGTVGRKLWRSILTDYEFDQHEMVLLERACRVADVCAALQAVVDSDGPMTTNRFGDAVAHPALVELRQQSIVFARLVAALRVPATDDDAQQTRPQQRRTGARGVYGIAGAS